MEDHDFPIYDEEEPGSRPFSFTLIILSAAAMLIACGLFLVMATGVVWAHSWYPARCCWSPQTAPAGRLGDCDHIPSEAVREGQGGYYVTLRAGEHPMVTETISVVVPYRSAQVSQDGEYHICFNSKMEVRCFFAGSRGS
jgi:hypothetical protein